MTRAVVSTIAAFCIGEALQYCDGSRTPEAMAWLVAALVVLAVQLVKPGLLDRVVDQPLVLLLACAAAILWLLQLAANEPLMYARASLSDAAFLTACAAAWPLAAGLTWDRARPWCLGLLVLVFLAMGTVCLGSSPFPIIDVDFVHRLSTEALLQGSNPYAMKPPSIYADGSDFYGPGTVIGGRVQAGYFYPPLSLLLATLARLLVGDYRFAQLAATAAAGLFIALARPSRVAFVCAALLLFTPRAFFIVEQGWTEPFVLASISGLVFCWCRWPKGKAVVLGLALVSKQYAVLLLWPMLLQRKRSVLVALGVAAAVLLPFIAWGPAAFWRSTVWLQNAQPYRPDTMVLSTASTWWMGFPLGGLTFLIGTKAGPTPSRYAFACATSMACFFAFGRQGAPNHWWLVLGLLALAAATGVSEPDSTGRSRS
jgi:hypothetical protein